MSLSQHRPLQAPTRSPAAGQRRECSHWPGNRAATKTGLLGDMRPPRQGAAEYYRRLFLAELRSGHSGRDAGPPRHSRPLGGGMCSDCAPRLGAPAPGCELSNPSSVGSDRPTRRGGGALDRLSCPVWRCVAAAELLRRLRGPGLHGNSPARLPTQGDRDGERQ